MKKCVKTICPYCGVGCGIEVTVDAHETVSVRGDVDHPANYGRLCSKGAALAETLSLDGRLLYPEIAGQRVSWNDALAKVADGFCSVIEQHGPDAVAFYVSGQLLTEDYYLANKLMKGFIGSANIDTNSRLCMSSAVAGYKRAFGADTVPCCYEDLERAKLVVLTGSNAAWCHPVLYQRINQAKKENPDLMVVVIDPRRTSSCDIADLHLPLKPGSDVVLFNGLLCHLQQHGESNALFVENYTERCEEALAMAEKSAPTAAAVAWQCELDESTVVEFYRLFARTERVVTVFSQGVNQSSSGTDKVNAIINCHLLSGRIGRPGMGPFSFTGQTNAMGGREVGGLANQLAAHMEIDNRLHRELVQRFWQSPTIADEAGLKALDLFDAVDKGEIKALWVMCTNPVVSMPDADRVRAALDKCELVVVSECVRDTDTTAVADVLLPALTWGEKSGTVTNSERRISRQRPFLTPPGEARADWQIICQVAQRMGFGRHFEFTSVDEVFSEHAALSGFENSGQRDFDISPLATLDAAAYESLMPIQWPLDGDGNGRARMFTNGQFYTASGKAQFVAVEPRPPHNGTDEDFPVILNTGRSRDQWHTMTRTGKAAKLTEHSPEPYGELHPDDALAYHLSDGCLIRIFSRWGEAVVRARISAGQQRGSLFVPMHWGGQFASSGRIDSVVNPVADPLSGQPEFKHTPVRISAYQPAWYGFLLSRRELSLHGVTYWARATGDGFYRYEIAGEQAPGDWGRWARGMLCESNDDVNWVEYLDVAARRYRGVRMVANRVESCLFIAPDTQLPPRSWLSGLFKLDTLDPQSRASLLTGVAPVGQEDVGRIVCACFSVGENTLMKAIRDQRLMTTEEIGKALKAGTNCGSCVPELRGLIEAARQP